MQARQASERPQNPRVNSRERPRPSRMFLARLARSSRIVGLRHAQFSSRLVCKSLHVRGPRLNQLSDAGQDPPQIREDSDEDQARRSETVVDGLSHAHEEEPDGGMYFSDYSACHLKEVGIS